MTTIAEPARIPGVTHLTVAGFKSLRDETTIDVRPLTVLAGTNSSGKSSMLQPLLLLKQTMDATYDPGALFLAGDHVNFTDFAQTLWRDGGEPTPAFTVRVELGERWTSETFFREAEGSVQVDRVESGPRGAAADFEWSLAKGFVNNDPSGG